MNEGRGFVTSYMNWGHPYRGWKLSEDGTHYVVTDRNHPEWKEGQKVIVVCHGHGDFEVFDFEMEDFARRCDSAGKVARDLGRAAAKQLEEDCWKALTDPEI